LQDLQAELGLTYMFISHDLSVIRHISTRVGVMYLGKLVELASVDELYRDPRHPYTKALLSAIPQADPLVRRERILLQGEVPSAANPPIGCGFSTRCPFVMDICRKEKPTMVQLEKGREAACHLCCK
jgi:oligopeptide transport system ATP-binding protein